MTLAELVDTDGAHHACVFTLCGWQAEVKGSRHTSLYRQTIAATPHGFMLTFTALRATYRTRATGIDGPVDLLRVVIYRWNGRTIVTTLLRTDGDTKSA